MSLIKNLNINIKNSGLVLASVFASLVCFNYFSSPNVSATDTIINAQVCQDGPKTAELVATTPSSGSSIYTSNINYKIQTNWATSIVVNLNGNQIFNQSIAYQPGVETEFPINQLLASPQINNLTIEIKGGCPERTTTYNTNLIFLADIFHYNKQVTKNRSPELNGEINNPDLEVRVHIQGRSGFFQAVNHHNGSWTLPSGLITPSLDDGVYDVKIESFNTVTNQIVQVKNYPNGLKIDNIAPEITFDHQDEYNSRSPELKGLINEPNTKIEIIINGNSYEAIIKNDGTWQLPAGTIHPLANGSYDLAIKATDPAGNISELNFTININAKNSLGFLIPPNTGYLRIGRTNIPSWLIYLVVIAIVSSVFIRRKQASKS